MKRKSLNVQKLKNILPKDKKILNLYSKLQKILSKNKNSKSFTVAVSGGPDSMALAGLSSILMGEKKHKVFFALVDHGIRKDSAKEAKQVKKLLQKQNIKLEILKNNPEYHDKIEFL